MNKKYLYLCFFIVALLILNLCCLINDRDITEKENKNEDIIYKNVIIKGYSDGKLNFINDGCELSYKVSGIDENFENLLADIEIESGNLTSITLKKESITGKVQAIGDKYIEIAGYGNVYLSNDFKCYFENKNYATGNLNDVKVGAENIRFVVEGKNICGIIIEGEIVAENVRVLLMNTGFKDYYHENASLMCGSDYKISYNIVDSEGNVSQTSNNCSQNEKLIITPDDKRLDYGRIRIELNDKNKKITFDSFTRNGNNPAYRGSIEIARYDGKIVIVNEVSLEEYLYSVVPSEMPSSYGVEALKVQAVCARSYAMCHLGGNELSKYGAQIDDSTNYQVYNNTLETENSIAAVDATRGEVLKYGEDIVNAYFFATSCGSTTDSTIWGGTALPYIKGKLLCSSKDSLDLMNNDVFTEFIKSNPESFDSETAWYRWNIAFSDSEITNIINNNIGTIYGKFPKYVLTKQNDGTYASQKISSVGNVLNISVELRGAGGVIEELLIIGDRATVKILKQSAIRNLINPSGIDINKADGTKVNNFTSLPSAYFAIERKDGGYILYGGGFGHGAGMSQTAVKEMINEGMDYKEILEFFYTDVNVETV